MVDSIAEHLQKLSGEVEAGFERQQRVLSFDEYLAALDERPYVFCRDASAYVRDMLDFYGTEKRETPAGEQLHYRLFDQPFLPEEERAGAALVGQETVQQEISQVLSSFVRVGAPNRVILLHGPNGSAKSTIAACFLRALEHYSAEEEGAVYRYDWVFPKKQSVRGAIGFGGEREVTRPSDSYAHLPDEDLDARVRLEVRDHPLFLLPTAVRRKLLSRYFKGEKRIPRWLSTGSLCDKSQKIFQALLSSYEGKLDEVLRHVRVERVFFSRRYRIGAATLGPELSVDARERQLTMDQNLAALPVSLQDLSLFEVSGELVDASGGILELSDLLKRPLDAFKYLQITAETGEASLASQTLLVNTVFIASGNEQHLKAFREHPEFSSFRGRLALIRVPYLLDYRKERRIYENQVLSPTQGHVAPHAAELAARFAVLTRLEKPDPQRYESKDRKLVSEMTAWQKLELYAGSFEDLRSYGSTTSLSQLTGRLLKEWDASSRFEGAEGVSPRTMRTVLLEAADHPDFDYLSPFAVLDELEELLEKQEDFSFLRRDLEAGGYHDPNGMVQALRRWLFNRIEEDLSQASGLVEEASYDELMNRYIEHVSAFVKGEKMKSPVTGEHEPPDESLMGEVEGLLGRDGLSAEDQAQARADFLGRIAAWSLDHPDQPIRESEVVREVLAQIRRAVFQQRQAAVAHFCHLLVDEDLPRSAAEQKQLESAERWLTQEAGYTKRSARDAAAHLIAERDAETQPGADGDEKASSERSQGDGAEGQT